MLQHKGQHKQQPKLTLSLKQLQCDILSAQVKETSSAAILYTYTCWVRRTGNNARILQKSEWEGEAEVSVPLQPQPLTHRAHAQSKAGLANLSSPALVWSAPLPSPTERVMYMPSFPAVAECYLSETSGNFFHLMWCSISRFFLPITGHCSC